jgi:hypothetical protein
VTATPFAEHCTQEEVPDESEALPATGVFRDTAGVPRWVFGPTAIPGGWAKRHCRLTDKAHEVVARNPFEVLVRAVESLNAQEQAAMRDAGIRGLLGRPYRSRPLSTSMRWC